MISMTPAIVSRCRIFQFTPLTQADILEALGRALTDERGFAGQAIEFESGVLEYWANVANGDARTALNALELAVTTTPPDAQGLVYISKRRRRIVYSSAC